MREVKGAPKPFHEMSIPERIAFAGWFKGTMDEFYKLPREEREAISFAATGCQVAAPSWPSPVTCYHIRCRIARGELPQIALTNSTLRGERSSGWLRFIEDRSKVVRIYRAVRKAAMQTGIYDPWQLPGGWQAMVFGGIDA